MRHATVEVTRSRILVTEDERIVARDLAYTLSELGYDVVGTVATGENAIQKTDELRPDLVLMDIRLSGQMDGIEAAQAIRQKHNIPVIYLTAHSDDETLRRARVTEPFGYLIKPFKSSELRCMIENAIYKHNVETNARDRLERLAFTDELTGLANRRNLQERLLQLMKEGRRGRQFTLVMLDIDHFKTVNDENGHVAGDQILIAVAATLTRELREVDFAARFGGDEFCLVMVDTTSSNARIPLDRIRARLADFPPPVRITASLGGCDYHEDFGVDIESILSRADKALYRAKQNGRNRVEFDGGSTGTLPL